MAKHEQFPFEPKWWLNNRSIRVLTDEARAVLLEIMIHMMDGYPYGSLVIGGVTYDMNILSKILGRSLDLTISITDELVRGDLLSVDETGIIYSDYMTHRYDVHKTRKKIGSMGGNPILKKGTTTAKKVEPKPEAEKVGEYYLTKKGRKVEGKQLLAFNTFWDVFDDKLRGGKADAADAWMDLEVNADLFDQIIKGAKAEVGRRASIYERGSTPKMAQGWLSGRRWET